jgi:hypothetical protein
MEDHMFVLDCYLSERRQNMKGIRMWVTIEKRYRDVHAVEGGLLYAATHQYGRCVNVQLVYGSSDGF